MTSGVAVRLLPVDQSGTGSADGQRRPLSAASSRLAPVEEGSESVGRRLWQFALSPAGRQIIAETYIPFERNDYSCLIVQGGLYAHLAILSAILMGLVGLCLLSAPESRAEEPSPSDKGAIVEGAGFTLYDMESIKGSDADRVERDPICDRSKRPKIHKVEPDEAKPGQKVTIKGENFGTKECFHGVASVRPDQPRSSTIRERVDHRSHGA